MSTETWMLQAIIFPFLANVNAVVAG
jgi:hypothetical protein